jgi:hypothetical protein
MRLGLLPVLLGRSIGYADVSAWGEVSEGKRHAVGFAHPDAQLL